MKEEQSGKKTITIPMIVLRGITAFPNMLLNFDVERPMSVAALDAATEGDRRVFLLTQKDVNKEHVVSSDLYEMGTISTIKQMLKLPGGGIRVMVEGICRAKFISAKQEEPYFIADCEIAYDQFDYSRSKRAEALVREAYRLFARYSENSEALSPDSVINIASTEDPGYLADYIAQNIPLRYSKKQEILSEINPVKRLERMNRILAREIEVLEIEVHINERLKERVMGGRREQILREQLRIIQSELGEEYEPASEDNGYREKILALRLPDEVEEKLLKEVDKLEKQAYGSAEAALSRTYLDTCIGLPWNKKTKERTDVARTRKILDRDHFGLEKVKERIVEFVAVKKLKPDMKGSILCLVGPPGTGKTSIGMSIAKALNRKLARISLGGIHDEAEIRGHRKTYVGAMPGRIMYAVNQAGSKNAVLLLDEIDKLGSDYRGDPSAALLEALDSEQNSTFRDHYLEVPFDLSDILFITTANTTDTIPRPLLDRMEIIELTSYTDEEKLKIVKNYLLPKQRQRHGITSSALRLTDAVIREIIDGYTRESGVRQLDREIAAICRKSAVQFAQGEANKISVTSSNLEKFLGVRKYKPEERRERSEVGLVRGLAWTSVGGEVLDVEVNVMDGNGKLELTGNLGDVMKESAKAAISYIRSRSDHLGISPDFYKNKDIHIHFPEGAVPKDGPSAGITVTIAVISALTGIPVRSNVAMTGEITLRGRILPIGGLKEKTMAAMRNGVTTVIIPEENEVDLEDIDPVVRNTLQFVTARHIDNILDVALDGWEQKKS